MKKSTVISDFEQYILVRFPRVGWRVDYDPAQDPDSEVTITGTVFLGKRKIVSSTITRLRTLNDPRAQASIAALDMGNTLSRWVLGK